MRSWLVVVAVVCACGKPVGDNPDAAVDGSSIGDGSIPPGWTLLSAVKVAAIIEVVKFRSPAVALSRESNATSEGELTRVGT